MLPVRLTTPFDSTYESAYFPRNRIGQLPVTRKRSKSYHIGQSFLFNKADVCQQDAEACAIGLENSGVLHQSTDSAALAVRPLAAALPLMCPFT